MFNVHNRNEVRMIDISGPQIWRKPAKKAGLVFRTAFNKPAVSDPAMAYSHHIEAGAWIGRLLFFAVRLYWNVNPEVPTSDAYARYSSRLYTQERSKG